MASTSSWYGLLECFEKLDMRVVLHDFMGQLKSAKPASPYTPIANRLWSVTKKSDD